MQPHTIRSSRAARRAWLVAMIAVTALAAAWLGVIRVDDGARAAPRAQSQWPTYLADPARDSASDARIGPVITPRWTHVLTGFIASEPALANNRVYIGAWDGYLYALDAFDGHLLWRTFLGTYQLKPTCVGAPNLLGITASPTYDPGSNLLFVSAMSATLAITTGTPFDQDSGPYLYALDADSGAIQWEQLLNADSDNYAWSSPLIVNGHAYVGIASQGDCPLTQGQLVSVDLAGTHALKRVAMAPDSLTVYPPNLVTNSTPATTTLLADQSDYNFTATATIDFLGPLSATIFIRLRNAHDGTFYRPELRRRDGGQTCETGLTFVQYLADAQQADSSGVLVFSQTVALDTAALNDDAHFLVVTPTLVPCSTFVAGVGGGIWSSPTYDAATHRVYVTTGTPTPPCVPPVPCTGARAVLGPRSAAVVAVNADTLAVEWSWQVPFAEQALDADFGATPTLCAADGGAHVLGVANKNGIFYAFDTLAPGHPIWQKLLAEGGGGPELAQGSISSAACAGGVFYVGAGRPPAAETACAGFNGQVWALYAASGTPRWAGPRCTSLVMGPVSAAGSMLMYGTNCRVVTCERRIELLDQATGAVRYTGTRDQLAALGDMVSGLAIADSLLVGGDSLPGPGSVMDQSRYFPPTGTVRALNAWAGLYLPAVLK